MTNEEAIDVLKHNYPSACFEGLCEAVEIAIKALSAELQRKKGKWNTFFSDSYKVHEIGVECSCCGYRTQERTNYCPNCGAEMAKGENDE